MSSAACGSCPMNEYSHQVSTKCMCIPGHTRTAGSSTCSRCAAGKFKSSDVSDEGCEVCKPGSFSLSSGAVLCNDCGFGKYSDQNASKECTQCTGNKITKNTGAATEASCVPPEGIDVCATKCPAGFMLDKSVKPCSCHKCWKGTYSTAEQQCVPCPVGFHGVGEGGASSMESGCKPCRGM